MTKQPGKFFWWLKFWLVAVALCASYAGHAGVVQHSNSFLNLSQDADPLDESRNLNAKVITAGSKVYVLWLAEHKTSGKHSLWLRRSLDQGVTWQTPQKIAGTNDLSADYDATWQPMAAEGDNVYIAYTSGWGPSQVLLVRSADSGQTFQSPQILHDGNYYQFRGVYLTADTGKVAVMWAAVKDDAPRPGLVVSSSSNDGGKTFTRNELISVTSGSPDWNYRYTVVDSVRSGDYVYALTTSQVENWFSSQSSLYLWGSVDGGRTFKQPVRVNVKATNNGYYAPRMQDVDYAPHLAAQGAEVSVVWINTDNPGSFDGWSAPSLRVARSTDAGASLGTPVTLYTYSQGYSTGARAGLETIVRSGSTLHVTSTREGTGTFYWRSTDSGATWGNAVQISSGGWWQHIGIDPTDSQKIHFFNGSWFRSMDGGATVDGSVKVVNDFGGWTAPQAAMTSSGVPIYVGNNNSWDKRHVYARALAPAPAAGATNKALQLVTSGDYRRDQFWVAARPAMEFSSAMTVEYWIKLVDGNPNYVLQTFLGKKRRSGENSWELAGWNGDQVFSRLVTAGTGSSYYGDWLGAGGSSLPKNTWAHLAMTYNASAGADNWKLYVNGALKAKATLTGAIVSELMDSSLRVGNQGSTASTVLVDELRLWNKARTASEIKAYMGLALNGNESGLVGYWNFNDTLRDSSPSNNDAVPQFMETFVADAPALTGRAPSLTACATMLTTDLTLNIPCIKFQSTAGASYVQATLSADSRLGALAFGLVDAFVTTIPSSDTGCVAQLDAQLNLLIPCVQYANQVWWLKFKFVTSGANFGFGLIDLGQGTPP